MFLAGMPPFKRPINTKMIDEITNLGLTSGLKLCLDAGDAASYTSGQVWLDRSGGGYDFNRGSGSGADGADPTFNGVAGRQSSEEYWSFDGGDYFTYDSANPSWVESLHKDNATFTIIEWIYASGLILGGRTGAIGNIGASIGIAFANSTSVGVGLNLGLVVGNSPTTNALDVDTASLSFNNNSWNMIGISYTESTGVLTFAANGSYEVQTGKTYSSPSAAAASQILQIGALGGSGLKNDANQRLAAIAMWDRALTQAEISGFYDSTKGKFGL
jgi:hypothetical protein